MISMEQEAMMNSSHVDTTFSVNVNGGKADEDQQDPNNHFQAQLSPVTAMESLNDLPFDISVSDCSDQIDDDDDDLNYQMSIDAERRRRKELNDRLYTLYSLVPKITKLDRASILGDAIEFVKELQKQVKDLQHELEENSEAEGGKMNAGTNSNLQSEILNDNGSGVNMGPKTENEEAQNQFHLGAAGNGIANAPSAKQNHETDQVTDDKTQQMEPQVEVAQIEANEFFVKVFCEHKAGGFVRLMEALSSLGLEVTNANVTSCKGLVSNMFKVEQKRDNEMVRADHVRASLLELS